MRHTLKESILQGLRSCLCRPRTKLSLPPVRSSKHVKGEALHVTMPCRLGAGDYAEVLCPAFQNCPLSAYDRE